MRGGKLDRLGNGGVGNLVAPGPTDLLPRHSRGDLVEHLPEHHPRALEGRLASAHNRISDNEPSEFPELAAASFEGVACHVEIVPRWFECGKELLSE